MERALDALHAGEPGFIPEQQGAMDIVSSRDGACGTVPDHHGGGNDWSAADRVAAMGPVLGLLQEPRAPGHLSGAHRTVGYY